MNTIVILPRLSKTHAAEDTVAFSNSLDCGLRLVLLMGVPATIGLLVLAEPMLSTLFHYNEFSVSDVHLAGQSLKAYAIGLVGFILIKVLVPGFTSRQDMKTPVRYWVYANASQYWFKWGARFSFGSCRTGFGNFSGRFF